MNLAGHALKTPALTLLLALAACGPAAAQGLSCLNPAERQQAVSGGQALPLAQAQRNLRPDQRGEVVNARLCRVGGNLVYLLTVVDRRGKVMRARIEAHNGHVIQVR